MSETNSITAELVTMFTINILIEGRDILPEIFRNDDIVKVVLIGVIHVEPRSVHALNETTFLVAYSSEVLAEDISSAIEKINEWFGKPVVIPCNEVTITHLPQVLEHVLHTTRVKSIVLNTALGEMQIESVPRVHSGYCSNAGGPAVLGASDTTLLNKVPDIPKFSGTEHEKDTVRFEQLLHSISDARRNFSEHLVMAAINKSCVDNAVNAICCLSPGTTLDDIIAKVKGLYGSVESFDTLMQEFYRFM